MTLRPISVLCVMGCLLSGCATADPEAIPAPTTAAVVQTTAVSTTSLPPTTLLPAEDVDSSTTSTSTTTTVPPAPLAGLAVELVTDELSQPIALLSPPGVATRIVAQRNGRVAVLSTGGTPEPEPFLDLTDQVLAGADLHAHGHPRMLGDRAHRALQVGVAGVEEFA